MGIEIKSEHFEVLSEARDEKTDQKLEPEEQPARKVSAFDAPTEVGGQVVGGINSAIMTYKTAVEFAQHLARQCRFCKHHDQKAWEVYLKKVIARGNQQDWRDLNKLRAILIETGNAEFYDMHIGDDGDFDVEHALWSYGCCRPLTEVWREAYFTHPFTSCPKIPGPNGEDCSNFFVPKDKKAPEGTSLYDQILMNAAGKIPG